MELENTPAWDLTTEYNSTTSPEYLQDEQEALSQIEEIKVLSKKLREDQKNGQEPALDSLRRLILLGETCGVLIGNQSCYINCASSIDATDEKLKALSSGIQKKWADFAEASNWIYLFLVKTSDENFNKIFEDPQIASQKFSWAQQRTMKSFLLGEEEEALLTAMGTSGFHSWSELYSNLCGTMRVKINMHGKTEELGLAHASALIRGPDKIVRKAAWEGIQEAWKIHQESAAAILNSLAGWRLELCKRRSFEKPHHFLDQPLLDNRIERKTLDAMLSAISKNLPALREGLSLMAKLHGSEKLHPWDLLAPAPVGSIESATTTFPDALNLIKKSFSKISNDLEKFVDVMSDGKRLEGRVLPNKANGGYCATFRKSRMPVVYQTYMGGSRDVFTLAHELGHAYHSWVLRDVPISECECPMTLAETASIFAETLLANDMIKNAQTRDEKIKYLFNNLEQLTSLLINIPARFEFEKNFYEARQERTLSARELSELTDKAWSKWYGDHLSSNDKMYWASKGHFSMSGTSFYNFPYTFGYLFALSIYARKDELGDKFHSTYVAILKDTGRMTAEDLIKKHLGEDIGDEKFWQKAINISIAQIAEFKSVI